MALLCLTAVTLASLPSKSGEPLAQPASLISCRAMPPEPSQVSKAGRRLQGPGGRRATRNDLDAVARGWLPVPAPGPAGRSAPLPSAASGGSPVSATMLALRFCLRRADTYHATTSLGARGTFRNVDPSRLITNDAHNYLKVRGANDMIIIKLRPATYDSCARAGIVLFAAKLKR